MLYRPVRVLACVAVAAFVVVLLGPAISARAQAPDVKVADNFFDPAELTLAAGASITWGWTGANPHTVTSTDGGFTSSAQKQGVGSTHSANFPRAGTYPYYCKVHGSPNAGMRGTITVTAAPAPSASATPAPRPTPAPTTARPAPSPSPSQTARPAVPSPTAQPTPAVVSPSAPVEVVASPSPSPTAVARTALLEPSLEPTPSRVPSRSAAPLVTLDEPLPKDRSGLAIALGLAVAAAGFGTAGALLLRRRRTEPA